MRACPGSQQVAQRGLGASVQLVLAAAGPNPNPNPGSGASLDTRACKRAASTSVKLPATKRGSRACAPPSPLCVAPKAAPAHGAGVRMGARESACASA